MNCVGCGAEIPDKRLRAMPLTEFCVECQAKDDVPPITPEQIPDALADVEIEVDQVWGR